MQLHTNMTHMCISPGLPLPSTCWPSIPTSTERRVEPTCALPSELDWSLRHLSWLEKKVGGEYLTLNPWHCYTGKGAGSYKIAKVGAEKSEKLKEKVEVVKKKAEAPKKVVKKTAEGKEWLYSCEIFMFVVEGKAVTKKATPKKVKTGSTSSAKGDDKAKTKKVVKKSAEKTSKSPSAKKVGKGSATKTGKSPAKPIKKVAKSPAAKKAAAKKATAKSPVAKKPVKKWIVLCCNHAVGVYPLSTFVKPE